MKKPRVSIPVDFLDKNEWKHNVQGYEVYEVFGNHPYIRWVEKGHRPGEDLYSAFGRTDEGRYLFVAYINKKDGSKLVLSAKDMTPEDRRIYEQR